MKLIDLAKEHIKSLRLCAHGGEVWHLNLYNPGRKDILDFSANVNPLGPSPKVIEAIKESLWKIPFYPDSNCTSLKGTISEHIGGISPENLIVGNGSTELIYMFTEVFIKYGEKALIPAPTFGEYEVAVKKAGGRPEYLPLTNGFKIDTEEFIGKIPHMKVVFLCNPNNPTSLSIALEDLSRIINEATKEDVLIFIDEDFMDFVPKEKRSSQVGEIRSHPNLFILKSFTKFFGLTGLRIGYGIGNIEMIDILSRAKMPWNINCLAEVAAITALEDLEFSVKTYGLIEEERQFLLKELRKIRGFDVLPPDANFFLINIEKTGLKADELKHDLLKFGILIRDCSSFEGLDDRYIRVAIRTRKENEYLVEALRKVCP
ncbi:MAG: histidinol-phosphate aminotransferase family protein [Candidatus Methylarchaceae archaeon HK02M1]|nr:histidinol-phosphate aminotransferase family protein [Candidatus Methylarchaceae archaeon HK02M1]